ncbi:Histidine phosphatase superfamily [compost metagenome]
MGKEVERIEELREKLWSGGNQPLSDQEMYPILVNMFADPEFALPGGESNRVCQRRAVEALMNILQHHQGERIVIGTHGMVMTLMMGYLSAEYGLDFLIHTSKPDIYRMKFADRELCEVRRILF